jgi:hypothetical protein
VEALRRTVEAAGDLGLPYLTVFGFSTENWRRPKDEVSTLLDLLRLYVQRDLDRLAREGVRVRVIGEREGLSADIVSIITDAEAKTRHNATLNLTIASVPLVLDYRNVKPEDLLYWHASLAQDISAGNALPLNRWLRMEEAPYLPGQLDKLISEARRDRADRTGQVMAQARAAGVRRLHCLSTRTAVPFYAALGFDELGPADVPLRPGIVFPAVRMRHDALPA